MGSKKLWRVAFRALSFVVAQIQTPQHLSRTCIPSSAVRLPSVPIASVLDRAVGFHGLTLRSTAARDASTGTYCNGADAVIITLQLACAWPRLARNYQIA
eukprot:2374-Heterococcus_DN1.PRE.8